MSYNASGQRARYTVSKDDTTSLDERYSYRDGELGQVVTISGTQTYTDTFIYDPYGRTSTRTPAATERNA